MSKETKYPDDKDWLLYKTDLNDGWADDVPLMYNEDGWSPDNEELTTIAIDNDNTTSSSDNHIDNDADEAKESDKDSESSADESSFDNKKDSSKKKIKPFRMFMILWIGVLLITIAILLDYFLDYLIKYQKTYEDTRPYHAICNVVNDFKEYNYDKIYSLITVKPELSEFETEEDYKAYIETVIDNGSISYKEYDSFNENFPKYHILSDGYIIADIELRKDPNKYADYKFPIWYISSFVFYSDPQFSCTVELPENYTLLINDIPVNNNYASKRGITLDEQSYYKDYIKLPTLKKMLITGLYRQPDIKVLDSQGKETEVVFNSSRGVYEASLGSYIDDSNDIKTIAINLISDYANYISDDAPASILNDRFIPESDMLDLIQSGSSRRFFDAHSKSEIKNAKVTEFKVYDNDAVFCRVKLDQILTYNSNKEYVNEVNLGVYLIKTEGGWKACTLQY